MPKKIPIEIINVLNEIYDYFNDFPMLTDEEEILFKHINKAMEKIK